MNACTERGCCFPASRYGLCLHHLRVWDFRPAVRTLATDNHSQCPCGKEQGHRGACAGVTQSRRRVA